MKRVFLIVLDSFGVGEAPDAAAFGDAGADTLRSVRMTGIPAMAGKALAFSASLPSSRSSLSSAISM